MRAMLEEVELPIEFRDEAAEGDCYMRSHTATGPMIDGEKTCPLKGFTGEIPSANGEANAFTTLTRTLFRLGNDMTSW